MGCGGGTRDIPHGALIQMGFIDRRDAGRRLSQALSGLRGSGVVVVGLPRGGVPVAFEVARALHAPLDVIVVRKLGVPFQPELAMGAIGEEGALVVDNGLVQALGVTQKELLAVVAEQRIEVEQRVRRFRGDRPRIPFNGQHVVIVDDGLATGATATAACQVARAQGAFKITVAVPVSSSVSAEKLARVADDVVCLEQPDPFYAVGQSYADFVQTSDKEVVELLRERADEFQGSGFLEQMRRPRHDFELVLAAQSSCCKAIQFENDLVLYASYKRRSPAHQGKPIPRKFRPTTP